LIILALLSSRRMPPRLEITAGVRKQKGRLQLGRPIRQVDKRHVWATRQVVHQPFASRNMCVIGSSSPGNGRDCRNLRLPSPLAKDFAIPTLVGKSQGDVP
jgi:hypothetical protein